MLEQILNPFLVKPGFRERPEKPENENLTRPIAITLIALTLLGLYKFGPQCNYSSPIPFYYKQNQ